MAKAGTYMKASKIALFVLAGAIFVTAAVLFFLYPFQSNSVLRNSEGGEKVGWTLAGVLLVLMAIFVIRTIVRSPKASSATKQRLLPIYELANQFHMPFGLVAVALMDLHFAFVFDIHDPSSIHFVTGYLMVSLMALTVTFGFIAFFNKTPKRKILTLVHQIIVVSLFLLFFVHIFVR